MLLLVAVVVVAILIPHQLTLVVVEEVLVHIERDQYQSEHIQYQQLFRLGRVVLVVLQELHLVVEVMLEHLHILEHLLHHQAVAVVVMDTFQVATDLLLVDLVEVVDIRVLLWVALELALHSQEQ
jgi:hypothetical protein